MLFHVEPQYVIEEHDWPALLGSSTYAVTDVANGAALVQHVDRHAAQNEIAIEENANARGSAEKLAHGGANEYDGKHALTVKVPAAEDGRDDGLRGSSLATDADDE